MRDFVETASNLRPHLAGRCEARNDADRRQYFLTYRERLRALRQGRAERELPLKIKLGDS